MLRHYSKFDRREYHESAPSAVARLRAFFAGYDWLQIFALLVLLSAGLLFIYSTGQQVGTAASHSYFGKQLQWLLLGGGLWFLVSLIDCRKIWFQVFAVLFYIASLVLLVVVLRIGIKVNGAVSWLSIPGVGFRLQPAEPAKIATILLLAGMFSSPLFKVNNIFCLGLAGIVTLLPFLLIARQPDFGSAMVFLPILAGIAYAAGLRWRHILTLGAIVLVIGGGAALNEIYQYKPFLKTYQRNRIKVFFQPDSDPHNSGYNQRQARLAVGSGGFSGKGIGQGTQNSLGFLPHTISNNDFIFSVIAEETGYLGCFLLIASYALLLATAIRTAWDSDFFGRYIAVGIACMIFTHCFVNIGMSIGLAPITGIPLPFVSYGGSFLLTGLLSCGLLQAVYRRNRQKE
ncbi:MAG: rod shape-determining protein RodA [Lentisphaeria bacterium]|nr:rod shape-determining protein RodA [Lentisphaeria bacterium]